MQKEVIIPEGTNLNYLIDKQNDDSEGVYLSEEELKFDSKIYAELPYPLSLIGETVESAKKRDISLMSLLTILGSVLTKCKVIDGSKRVGCQLYTYILGNPAEGKGFVAQLHKTVRKIDEKNWREFVQAMAEVDDKEPKPLLKRLLLPGDSTKAALGESLYANNGFGLIYETEADTLVTANKGNYGGFTDILRKGAHGESYSLDRKYLKGQLPIRIDEVNIGVFLTSTLNQCFRLIPDYDDGLFSRFLFYLLPPTAKYESPFKDTDPDKMEKLINATERVYFDLHQKQDRSDIVELVFTGEQKRTCDDCFEYYQEQFKVNQTVRLIPSLKRMRLAFFRICMLLSYLSEHSTKNRQLTCQAKSFNIALTLILKLIEHLQIVDDLYRTRNQKFTIAPLIPEKTGEKQQLKQKALRLIRTGKFTLREISIETFGNASHSGTISKWSKKYQNNVLPLPEAEASPETGGEIINVQETLENTQVSVFENMFRSTPITSVPLLDVLTTSVHKNEVGNLKDEADEAKRRKIKSQLLAFTPSGVFEGSRKKENLSIHSKFICIDIDMKENLDVANWSTMKEQLKNIVNLSFCARSVSGTGYYALIPIGNPKFHEEYFDSLHAVFKKLGINIDRACRDVSRLRIISFDDECYLAKKSVRFLLTKLPRAMVPAFHNSEIESQATEKRFFDLLEKIKRHEVDITEKYTDWRDVGFAIANYFGEGGRNYYHEISRFYPKYSVGECDKQYSHCLKERKGGRKFSLKKVNEIASRVGVLI